MNKKLFAFDMDGTLLTDSRKTIVSDSVKKIIKELKQKGHIVCLFTGRPWRASKKIYDELKLDTIVVNYNGAYIHHPKKYDFIPIIENIEINYVMRIIDSKELQKVANNIVVEGPQYIHLQKNKKSFFTDDFIQVNDKSLLTTPIQFPKMTNNPTGVLVEIKKEYANNIYEITNYFNSKYGDLASFSYWETDNNNPIMEFANLKAKKNIALVRVARYYKVAMTDTIAFGDGYNDIGMLKVAGVGVAMNNASDIVKSYANVVSRHTNKNNGVAKFIEWYFDKGAEEVDATIYTLGQKKPKNRQVRELD